MSVAQQSQVWQVTPTAMNPMVEVVTRGPGRRPVTTHPASTVGLQSPHQHPLPSLLPRTPLPPTRLNASPYPTSLKKQDSAPVWHAGPAGLTPQEHAVEIAIEPDLHDLHHVPRGGPFSHNPAPASETTPAPSPSSSPRPPRPCTRASAPCPTPRPERPPARVPSKSPVSWPDLQPPPGQLLLHRPNRKLGKVKDRRRQRRLRPTLRQRLVHVPRPAPRPRRDHRQPHDRAHRLQELHVISIMCPIPIHRGEQDLPRPQLLGERRPLDRIAPSLLRPP